MKNINKTKTLMPETFRERKNLMVRKGLPVPFLSFGNDHIVKKPPRRHLGGLLVMEASITRMTGISHVMALPPETQSRSLPLSVEPQCRHLHTEMLWQEWRREPMQ